MRATTGWLGGATSLTLPDWNTLPGGVRRWGSPNLRAPIVFDAGMWRDERRSGATAWSEATRTAVLQ